VGDAVYEGDLVHLQHRLSAVDRGGVGQIDDGHEIELVRCGTKPVGVRMKLTHRRTNREPYTNREMLERFPPPPPPPPPPGYAPNAPT